MEILDDGSETTLTFTRRGTRSTGRVVVGGGPGRWGGGVPAGKRRLGTFMGKKGCRSRSQVALLVVSSWPLSSIGVPKKHRVEFLVKLSLSPQEAAQIVNTQGNYHS
jgi:hypothetical protein